MDGRSSSAALPASAAGTSASAPIPAPSRLTSTFFWSHILDAGSLCCKALLEIWWFSESWQPQAEALPNPGVSVLFVVLVV